MNKKINSASYKFLSFLRGDSARSSASKIKASIFAIIIGFAIGAIPIAATGGDVFIAYTKIFTEPFNIFSYKNTLVSVAVFMLLGAGIGISFKTGLFNIGAAGQFLMAGTVTVVLGIQNDWAKGVSIPVLILISAMVGAAASAIAGAMKAFFNVHEVVSTLLLNWVFFYISKYVFKLKEFQSIGSENSKEINESMRLSLGLKSFDFIYALVIAVLIIGIIWFMFKYTTFGYKLKVNGLNKDAAHYAGMNIKSITIYSMALSGALAGVAGFIYYNGLQGQMPALGSSLPAIGFEAITVTLLAFSSPIGAIIAGLFYGTINIGIQYSAPLAKIPNETINLVLGLIILFASIAPIMVSIRPIDYIRKKILTLRDDKIATAKDEKIKTILKLKTSLNKRLSTLKEEDASAGLIVKKFLKDNQIQPTKKYENKKFVEFIQKKKLRRFLFEYYQHLWSKELNVVNSNFGHKRITIIERDEQILAINSNYKSLFSKYKLNELRDTKLASKENIIQQRKIYKLYVLDRYNKYKQDNNDRWLKKGVR